MPTLADVLASNPKPSWHESVALVQEIASQLGAEPMPAAQDLLLAEDGTLTFGFAGESGRPQVADLADLLERLLSGVTAPQSLLDLAHENARPEPAHTTLAGFCRALKFYERPNRAADLAAVAGRVAGAEPPADLSSEVPAPVPEPVPPALEKPTPQVASSAIEALQRLQARLEALRVSRGELVVAASAIVLIVVLVLAGALMGSRSPAAAEQHIAVAPSSSPAPATPAAPVVPSVASSGPGVSHRVAQEKHSARPPQVRAPRLRAETPTATGQFSRVALPAPPANAASPSGALPTPAGQFPVVAWTQPDPRVYSADDLGVKPPKMLRQLLPDVAPDAVSGYLEVLVDAQGYVESVRLISPETRLEDFGLVAAAKAWKFSPALLNGRPVRYRMRLPIPTDGPPERDRMDVSVFGALFVPMDRQPLFSGRGFGPVTAMPAEEVVSNERVGGHPHRAAAPAFHLPCRGVTEGLCAAPAGASASRWTCQVGVRIPGTVSPLPGKVLFGFSGLS